MFDTHCHLNFKAFDGRVEEAIKAAKKDGVNYIVVPGTDVATSKKAVDIAKKHKHIYAAVGIHPHHIKKYQISNIKYQKDLSEIEKLLSHPKVVAVGEVGIDRYQYQKTKHKDYKIDKEFVDLQKYFFLEQIKLAHVYKKALIIHNREAKKEVLEILKKYRSFIKDYSAVFHCCEPDTELLDFAKNNKMFIGVDGDVVYWREKQDFIKKVLLEMLVLETDSPFLSPFRKFPNEPKNILFIAEFIAKLLNYKTNKVGKKTVENAKRLFSIDV